MKDEYRSVSLQVLCRLFGVTRQAYYQHLTQFSEKSLEAMIILKEVQQIRINHRRMGCRKLYELLEPIMLCHQIKMGRDALFDLLRANGLLVRKTRRSHLTTNSFHWLRKYPNRIRDFVPTGRNQLWVSDITYWRWQNQFFYISFVTDAYTHKIVGYQVAKTLEAIESISALKMAIKDTDKKELANLIHHSDRGVQYCSQGYVKLLQDNSIEISMTENGDPLENAIAERVNGIIKNEYLFNLDIRRLSQAQLELNKAVKLYNNERPHMSLGMLTPRQVHEQKITPVKIWKNYYQKKSDIDNPMQDIHQPCKDMEVLSY
jgi:transposase InsO family protein